MLFDWRGATLPVQRRRTAANPENTLWKDGVKLGDMDRCCRYSQWAWFYHIPAHVNYLLFALDIPEAQRAVCNENPESQGLRLKKREEKKKKQRGCHYHIISVWSIMNEMHIEKGVHENDLCE